MNTPTVPNSSTNNNFIAGDLIQNREYPLTFGVVVRSDWAANGRIPGYVVRCDAAWYRGRALQFIPADLAELLHRDEPVTVTLREDVLVAACSLPTDPGAVSHEPIEVREARAAEWDRVRLSGIEAAERMKAKGDSQRVTARILGDALGSENETINGKLAD